MSFPINNKPFGKSLATSMSLTRSTSPILRKIGYLPFNEMEPPLAVKMLYFLSNLSHSPTNEASTKDTPAPGSINASISSPFIKTLQ